MPSSYTSSLRLVLPVTGELQGAWGDTVNNGLTSLVDSAIAGTASIAMTDANYTLSANNELPDEARCMFINLTGTLTTTRNVICPDVSKLYFVHNGTNQPIVFTTLLGTGVTVASGSRMVLYCNATNVVPAVNDLPAASKVAGIEIVTVSGTQTLTNKTINLTSNTLVATSAQIAAAVTDETGTGALVFAGSPALTGTPTAPTAAAGTNTTQVATTAHVFAERTNTATLTNKTISGANNTLSNIGNSSLTNSSITFGSTAQALGSTVSALNGVSIGATTASTGAFTNLAYTGTLTGGTGAINIGSGQLYKDASGNVGIGTSSPGNRLHVVGPGATAKLEANTATGGQLQFINTSGKAMTIGMSGASTSQFFIFDVENNKTGYNYFQGAGATDAHVFYTNNTERMRITPAGNVGIGTSSPGSLLHLSIQDNGGSYTTASLLGSGTNSPLHQLRILNTSDDAGSESGLLLQTGSSNQSQWTITNQKTGSTVGDLIFRTRTGSTTSAERMRITSAGNVGIGTSAPGQKLDVIGGTNYEQVLLGTNNTSSSAQRAGLNYRNFANTSNIALIHGADTAGTSANIFVGGITKNPNIISFYTTGTYGVDGSERMRIDGAGNVGIGITTPSHAVHLAGSGASGRLHVGTNPVLGIGLQGALTNVTDFGGRPTVASLDSTFGGGSAGDIGIQPRTGVNSNIRFFTENTERMRIDSAGNVGIGTAGPAFGTGSGLQVRRTAAPSTVRIDYADGANSNALEITADSPANGIHINGLNNSFMRFSTASSERMRITNAGNVGIGTSSPNVPLEVAGNIHVSGGNRTIFNRSNNVLAFGTNNTERMRIDSSGNVLVGTTAVGIGTARFNGYNDNTNIAGIWANSGGTAAGTPVQRLYHFEADSTTSATMIQFINRVTTGVGSITSTGSSTSYNTSSDYRLKEDWQPMQGALTRLNQLKPVNFAWKADGSRVDGFLAHEAQEVVPEAVTGTKDAVDKDGKPEYQGIDQAKLVPLLTAALQEAVAEINSLKARLDAANL